MNLSEAECGYVAGLIDGEGCIHIPQTGCTRLEVTNTYLPVLEWLRATFGGIVVRSRLGVGHLKTCYRWQIVGRSALDVLQMAYPFMRIKSPQARLALDFDAQRVPWRRGEDAKELRDGFRLAIHSLNS